MDDWSWKLDPVQDPNTRANYLMDAQSGLVFKDAGPKEWPQVGREGQGVAAVGKGGNW